MKQGDMMIYHDEPITNFDTVTELNKRFHLQNMLLVLFKLIRPFRRHSHYGGAQELELPATSAGSFHPAVRCSLPDAALRDLDH
jgi:hypothetical protein